LFDLQKESEQAIRVYRQAAKHLEITKNRCGGVSRAFLKEGENFYYEYAELLHRQSVANNEYLEELTCVIDSFKTTQLQNYFYSGCPYDIIDNTRRLRGSDNRGIMTCFDKKSSTPTAAALSYPSVATTLSYPFVFASSLAKNITSLLGVGYSIMPQFGSIGLSLGLRKQSGPGLLKTQLPPSEEPFKFDENFFRTNPSTAVLYLFMYDQNPEYKDVDILLKYKGSPDGQRFQPVTQDLKLIKKEVENFRTAIENQEPLDKIHQIGGQLYNWLIGPVASTIGGGNIDTLILVPNSTLHTLPFAALWNGQYLIEKYALVVEPTANFVILENHTSYEEAKVLLGGFSGEVVVGGETYQSLNVQADINNLQETFGRDNITKLVGEEFVISNIETQLKNYPVVHLTTHGSFGKDDKQGFLLVHGTGGGSSNRVELLNIERFRGLFMNKENLPLRLLTLSACKSALGDEKEAALGLTGVAVGTKIGAVGTLWEVNDIATTKLTKKFYEELKLGSNKAHALKTAQKFIIEHSNEIDPQIPNSDKFKHPYYWAAFLIAGNWL